MRETLRKCKMMLSAFMILTCIVGLTGCESNNNTNDTPIIEKNAEISEYECTILAMPTTTETITDSSVGYSYGYGIQSDGKFGFGYGLVPMTEQKEITKYYIIAKYNDNYYCRFQLDELDWKRYQVGESIILQVFQTYGPYGGTNPPYVAYNGAKLKDYEKLSEDGAKAVEKEYETIAEYKCEENYAETLLKEAEQEKIEVTYTSEEEQLEMMERVDKELQKFTLSMKEESEEIRKENAEKILNALVEQGLMRDYQYDDASKLFTFTYANGVLGGLQIGKFGADMNSAENMLDE